MRLEREVGQEEQWEPPRSLEQGIKGSDPNLGYTPLGAVLARWKGDHLMGLVHSFHEPLEPPLGARPYVAAGIQERGCSGLDGSQDGEKGQRFGEALSLLRKHVLAIHKLASGSWTSCV